MKPLGENLGCNGGYALLMSSAFAADDVLKWSIEGNMWGSRTPATVQNCWLGMGRPHLVAANIPAAQLPQIRLITEVAPYGLQSVLSKCKVFWTNKSVYLRGIWAMNVWRLVKAFSLWEAVFLGMISLEGLYLCSLQRPNWLLTSSAWYWAYNTTVHFALRGRET